MFFFAAGGHGKAYHLQKQVFKTLLNGLHATLRQYSRHIMRTSVFKTVLLCCKKKKKRDFHFTTLPSLFLFFLLPPLDQKALFFHMKSRVFPLITTWPRSLVGYVLPPSFFLLLLP